MGKQMVGGLTNESSENSQEVDWKLVRKQPLSKKKKTLRKPGEENFFFLFFASDDHFNYQ